MQPEKPEAADREENHPDDEARANDVDQAFDVEADSTAADSSDLAARLAEAEREALRAKAEMENYRKRLQRESELQLKYANLPLVRDLLEVIDNLQRAISAASEKEGNVEALKHGVAMVNDQLLNVLGKYGCKQVDALGETFDPNVHEAIAQAPSEEHESGKVMQEVATGYLLHDRVVRPSTVIVSSGGPKDEQGEQSSSAS